MCISEQNSNFTAVPLELLFCQTKFETVTIYLYNLKFKNSLINVWVYTWLSAKKKTPFCTT